VYDPETATAALLGALPASRIAHLCLTSASQAVLERLAGVVARMPRLTCLEVVAVAHGSGGGGIGMRAAALELAGNLARRERGRYCDGRLMAGVLRQAPHPVCLLLMAVCAWQRGCSTAATCAVCGWMPSPLVRCPWHRFCPPLPRDLYRYVNAHGRPLCACVLVSMSGWSWVSFFPGCVVPWSANCQTIQFLLRFRGVYGAGKNVLLVMQRH